MTALFFPLSTILQYQWLVSPMSSWVGGSHSHRDVGSSLSNLGSPTLYLDQKQDPNLEHYPCDASIKALAAADFSPLRRYRKAKFTAALNIIAGSCPKP